MKQTVSVYDFHRAFETYNRKDNFSYEGLNALFEWLESLGDDTGEEQELDVIGLCCDFSEYENLKDFQESYGNEYKSLEDIEEYTSVIPVNDYAFIIQDF